MERVRGRGHRRWGRGRLSLPSQPVIPAPLPAPAHLTHAQLPAPALLAVQCFTPQLSPSPPIPGMFLIFGDFWCQLKDLISLEFAKCQPLQIVNHLSKAFWNSCLRCFLQRWGKAWKDKYHLRELNLLFCAMTLYCNK